MFQDTIQVLSPCILRLLCRGVREQNFTAVDLPVDLPANRRHSVVCSGSRARSLCYLGVARRITNLPFVLWFSFNNRVLRLPAIVFILQRELDR